MPNLGQDSLEFLFHPRSIALAGITTSNPQHWTRTFLNSLLEFRYENPIYLVNPKGGKIGTRKIYRKLEDIPNAVDYVISTVPASAAPGLFEECANKGVKVVHFCTSGFSETGEEKRARLEAQLTTLSKKNGIRIIGPNCMGIYCPQSRLSFQPYFPKESGPVGFISQSGGNVDNLVNLTTWRGVRFSKVISFGNACDLNESDFLEYLATDPKTKIIALYIEGVKDGRRFYQALEKATAKKPVILLKGGVTEAGAKTTAAHTGSLAGSEATWNALCKQLGIIRVQSMEELADMLVTLVFIPHLRGRRIALIGGGGGASVLITDEFERRGLKVPPLPPKIKNQIKKYTPVAGNILSNPIDYSQTMGEIEKLARTTSLLSHWEGIDLLIGFFGLGQPAPRSMHQISKMSEVLLKESRVSTKLVAMIIRPSILPEVAKVTLSLIQKCASSELPVYHSYAGAATAIDLVCRYNEGRYRRQNNK